MKKTKTIVLRAAGAGLLAALCAGAQAQAKAYTTADLWASAEASPAAGFSAGLAVAQGGAAPIETALATIIPQPYRIELDARVPATMVLSWQAGSDWMAVLRQALAPVGLTASPNWSTNSILIALDQPPAAAPRTAPLEASPIHPAAAVATAALPVVMRAPQGATSPEAAIVAPIMSGFDDSGWSETAPPAPPQPIALSEAVMMLMPTSMVSTQLAIVGVDDSETVTWAQKASGTTRGAALEGILRHEHLHATIRHGELRIESDLQVKGKAEAVNAPVSAKASAAKPVAIASTHDSAPAQPKWVIAKGQTIDDALAQWARTANWTVQWNMQRIAVPHETVFRGTFVEAATALLNDLAANCAQAHQNCADLDAQLSTANNTLVVQPGGSKE